MAKPSSAPGVLQSSIGAATLNSASDSGLGHSALPVGRGHVSERAPERSLRVSMLIGIVGISLIAAAFYVAGIGVR